MPEQRDPAIRALIVELGTSAPVAPVLELEHPGERGRLTPAASPARPAWAVASVAAAAVVLLLGGALLAARWIGNGEPAATVTTVGPATTLPAATTLPPGPTTSEATTTTAGTTTTTEPAVPVPPAMSWERLPYDPVFDDAWITAVTEGGPGLVAVGYFLEEPYPADWHSDAAVWVSADGRSWERIGDASAFPGDDPYFSDVAAGPEGLTAIGFEGFGVTTPFVWTSPDGTEWARANVPGVPVAFDGGYLAIGSDGLNTLVWVSDDGAAWTPVEDDTLLAGDSGPVAFYDAAAAGPGLVAVGAIGFDDPSVTPPKYGSIWVSGDGIEWEEVAGLWNEGVTTFERISADPETGRMLAFGWEATWWSDDGLTWQAVEAPDGPPPAAGEAVWDGDRVVVVGTAWESLASAWVSDDGGRTLYRVEGSEAFEGSQPDMADVVRFGDSFVAVGGDKGQTVGMIVGGPMIGYGGRGVVWTGAWEE